MNTIKKFEYQDTPISFEFSDGNKMINATEMAKPFKKLVADFLRLKSTKTFITLLEDRYGNSHIGRNVLRVVKGGEQQQFNPVKKTTPSPITSHLFIQ